MVRSRDFFCFLAVGTLAVLCCAAGAQSGRAVPQALAGAKPVQSYRDAVPFALSASAPSKVKFISVAQMSAHDHALAEQSQKAIARDAALADMEFRRGNWTEQQVACPALPNHLFLRLERNQGPRDMSMFSVSIPRNGTGRVRVIPILRRSYSLFAPAAANERTVAIFNQIRKEENATQKPDWLGIGLCYAALAGANPNTVMQNGTANGMPPVLQVQTDGGAIIRFVDEPLHQHPVQWAMVFNENGILLKVARSSLDLPRARAVPASSSLKFHAVPAGAPLAERSVPSSK